MIKEFKTAVVILDQLFPFLDDVYVCLIIIGIYLKNSTYRD